MLNSAIEISIAVQYFSKYLIASDEWEYFALRAVIIVLIKSPLVNNTLF